MFKATIVGGSGYTGGELLRLLDMHPEVEVTCVTSERLAGKPVSRAHPNLRKRSNLEFCSIDALEPCDILFLCLPHGSGVLQWDRLSQLAPRIIDLSADYRLRDESLYRYYYKKHHPRPELLQEFVYGIPERRRDEIRQANRIACAGCNATVSILSLYPLYREGLVDPDRTVIDVKVGSSEGGNRSSDASHHPERSGCVRSFAPTGHRHVAEITQELNFGKTPRFHFSATSIEMVRGALATCHVFLNQSISERDIWRLYREYYGAEPFVRIVKEREGIYRYPEPKILAGTNYFDLGFELDPDGERLVVIGAIDNLMKGAAGQAVQNMNLMCGFTEQTALDFAGLHPV